MATTESLVDSAQIRIQFLEYLFGVQKGFLCLATATNAKVDFRQHFFEWPEQKSIVGNFIEEQQRTKNVWFCTSLLSQPERTKKYCLRSSFAWSEFDETPAAKIEPEPNCIVESSPGKFHIYWRVEGEPIPADVIEDFSKRLTYSLGADKGGWALTKLLRVPWTLNHKYDPPVPVKLVSINEQSHPIDVFDRIAAPSIEVGDPNINGFDPLPTTLPALDSILYKFKSEGRIDDEFASLFAREPEANADWSKILWRFINKCYRIGMTAEEAYVVAGSASCNKYTRDNRPPSYLWREVQKAQKEHKQYQLLLSEKSQVVTMPHLVDFDDFEEDTFIKDYKYWANRATDAPEQYHELTCFISLSAVVCSGLWLAVDWGEIVPNLWGLLLGESTLTRKTTAMRLAVDMLKDIDESLILATDGSAEGLLSGLQSRPRRVSIFWKDEVSGLFDSINRKDYLAGLPETLTQLYDVPKVLTRLLRKETITISEPYFIFFGGGIRDKVYSLINDEYILSGFLPRFLVVSGENDLSRLRRTGPPTEVSTERKDNIIRSLSDIKDRYNATVEANIQGHTIEWPARIEARLTPKAWEFYGDIEDKLTLAGHNSDMAMLALPTLSRLGFSLLKMSLLVAASRREPDSSNRLAVELHDVKQAAFYVERWGHYSIDLLSNAGRSKSEKLISRAISMIKRREGLPKSELMQRMHLDARDAKDLIDTMSQRGLIDVKPAGRGVRLYSV